MLPKGASPLAGETLASAKLGWLFESVALALDPYACLTSDDRAWDWPRIPGYPDHPNGGPKGPEPGQPGLVRTSPHPLGVGR